MDDLVRAVKIDDQPISAGFFGEGKWLSDFVTPEEPDIYLLWNEITKGIASQADRIVAAWDWVANQVKYKPFIAAKIEIEGQKFFQEDTWLTPSLVSRVHVGNCANKAFLLTSFLRNELSPDQVHCVLGNLYNGHMAGHAWVEVRIDGKGYIVESTRGDVPLIESEAAERYEPVHYFNDQIVLAVPDRTIMQPFSACYSDWLRDYIDMNFVNGGR